MDTARKTAYETLLRIFRDGAYSNLALSAALNEKNLTEADSAFASAIVYTAVERQITIDYNLSLYLTQPIKKLRPEVLTVLRMGAAQILFLDKVPSSAAVNESVRLIKSNKKTAFASGLVNAVLRKVAANGLCLPPENDPLYRSVRWSCPQWLVEMWTEAYGEADTDGVLACALGGTDTTVRVNTLKTTAAELAALFRQSGIEAIPSPLLPDALVLHKCGAPEKTEAFRRGLFHVQDIASQLCCAALDVQPGDTVYDVCSAPGGKAFTLAETMQNTGTVFAFDIYPQRVHLIEQGAARLGIRNLRTGVADAAVRDCDRPLADRVLCDVPCAGLGVIAKKPEIRCKKWEDIDKLSDLQYNILCVSCEYLKKGGRLVYSTCSLNPEENEKVCQRFLRSHPTFRTVPILSSVDCRRQDNMITLLPHRTHSDGFFIAAFAETE